MCQPRTKALSSGERKTQVGAGHVPRGKRVVKHGGREATVQNVNAARNRKVQTAIKV